jgi:hypothetical protein
VLASAQSVWHEFVPTLTSESPNPPDAIKKTRQRNAETKRRHAIENHEKDLVTVQQLEQKLEIESRWTPASAEWKAASELVGKRRYQRCLDNLEGLIVSRMFELTKMNMSQTGMCFP